MQFALNDIQLSIKKMAREITVKEFAPRAAHVDETGEFPWDNVAQMRDAGFLGMTIPEEYGGGGFDEVSFNCVVEEISRACISTSGILCAHFLGVKPLIIAGSEEQKRKYLPLLAGEMLGSFAITEANAGSDAAAMATSAARHGDEYVLNGTKVFITNGGEAGQTIVFAKTDPTAGARGVSSFIVEKGTPGLSFGKKENKMGDRGSCIRELIFEDCRVPRENRVGKEGDGFKIAMKTLDDTRTSIGAQAVGLAQGAFDAALDYAKQRVVFGKPIAQHQAIAFMLADMATEIEAARLLVYRAAALLDAQAERYSAESAMAKLFASEMSHRVVHKALQIHGGYGYMKEYPIERFYRDQRIIEIYEGTSEIQRMVISSNLIR
ncbi:MAG: acyl-CoA dehydrogenase family protein [Chloroflexi bacterium]|nr:acyl-CoA dehydrogenase family protein [Chloroflexota bacterium]